MDDADAQLLDRLADIVDQASDLEDDRARASALEMAGGDIAAAIATTPHADLYYLFGYAWYLHPQRMSSEAIQDKVENALKSALKLDPDHARSWMFLGHQALDLCNFENARDCFQRVDLNQLGSYWQMKVHEMRVCCEIALNGLGPALRSLEKFVELAEQSEVQDIWPSELAKWMGKLASTLHGIEAARLRRLAQRLDAAGHFTKWFFDLSKPERDSSESS